MAPLLAQNLALVGGTIYPAPDAQPIKDGVVLVREGRIAAVGDRKSTRIPRNIQRLDCSGLTITAGFWNSHVHFFERKWANAGGIPASELSRQIEEMFTRYGFTSVFDLTSAWDNTRLIRDRIESGEVPGPRIRSTGEGLVPPGAVPAEPVPTLMGMMKTPLPEVTDAGEAAEAARKLLAEGVDGIKLFVSSPRGPSLAESTIQAAAAEAHRTGKPVFVHPNTTDDVLTALRAGVDVIAHTTPASGDWAPAVAAAGKEHRAALIPTLQIWKYQKRHDRISAQEQYVGTAVGQLRSWMAAGGEVLFGTDAGAVDYDPTVEYVLMAESGMSFRQILAALTTAPASRFVASKRLGSITAGFDADLVVLGGDPAQKITALAAVRFTIRAGRIVYRSPD